MNINTQRLIKECRTEIDANEQIRSILSNHVTTILDLEVPYDVKTTAIKKLQNYMDTLEREEVTLYGKIKNLEEIENQISIDDILQVPEPEKEDNIDI